MNKRESYIRDISNPGLKIEANTLKKAIEEGLEEGIEAVAHKLFKERQDMKFVEKVTALSIEKLVKIKNNI